MKILAVIPARYQSQRFPGKPLALVGDRPMIEWVYQAAKNAQVFDEVIVATDSPQIATCVRNFGGKVEMTREDHLTGTDRVAEVATRYPKMQVVANVQGDQPFVTTEALQQLVSPYLQGEAPEMTTLGCPLNCEEDRLNPHTVKVICSVQGHALYFSRAAIPYFRNRGEVPVYHHLGLYAFRRDFLAAYAQLTPTPLEQCEGLEQLRVLEHGYTIRVAFTQTSTLEINTPEDLERAQLFVSERIA